jgi:hypothetical protein
VNHDNGVERLDAQSGHRHGRRRRGLIAIGLGADSDGSSWPDLFRPSALRRPVRRWPARGPAMTVRSCGVSILSRTGIIHPVRSVEARVWAAEAPRRMLTRQAARRRGVCETNDANGESSAQPQIRPPWISVDLRVSLYKFETMDRRGLGRGIRHKDPTNKTQYPANAALSLWASCLRGEKTIHQRGTADLISPEQTTLR